MKLRDLFIINAVILFVFGLGFLVLTGPWFSFYGLAVSASAMLLARFLGGVLLAGALLSWLIREAVETELQRLTLLAFALGWAISFIVALIDQLGKPTSLTGWFMVAIFLLFTLAFSTFGLRPVMGNMRFRRMKPSQPS